LNSCAFEGQLNAVKVFATSNVKLNAESVRNGTFPSPLYD
jgi:hypothetical protein